ncbi:MAG: methylaspartate mutase accessory protein GlmL, partial [Oscillospiraceae bacterium]|nr:methylaspartate mutase accessory protein GlmL [Oscillospiraceae bacterium]
VETDISHGLDRALAALEVETGKLDFVARFACSSAAGGLSMVACGLTPSLTETAARMACLGAGAKVIRSFSHKLTSEDVAEIEALSPDILLLAGGTDGGNEAVITHNAAMLAEMDADFPIVYAGNRNAATRCREILTRANTVRPYDGRVYVVENVMPRLEVLNPEPVQQQVRELFLERIIHAKGLTQIAAQMSGPILPTPAAVLDAAVLLASEIGELLVIDLGGATTDVYSMARGVPQAVDTILRGIQEPFAKRTVEGDIGMRVSAPGVLHAVGVPWMAEVSGLSAEEVETLVPHLAENPDSLPDTPAGAALDRALASAAVMTAATRHAGVLETIYGSQGTTLVQTGKDLTGVGTLILTGGAIVRSGWAEDVARYALFDGRSPTSLRPVAARVYVDGQYILAAMGLLANGHPEAALKLMKKELIAHGTVKQAAH